MSYVMPSRTSCLSTLLLMAFMAGSAPAARAQAITLTYELDNVWLLPDISHPSSPAQQMTGTFDWTYQPGDFENGSGEFSSLSIPWFSPADGPLEVNFDTGSIEFTLPGNLHDLGVDLTLFLSPPFSPDQSSTINNTTSLFDIQNGISHKGHVISGSIEPPLVAWTDLGGASPGINGPPALAVAGNLSADSDLLIDLVDAPANALMLLRASLTSTPINVVGGTLYATPFNAQLFLVADAAGQFGLTTVVAPGLPPGADIYLQFIVQDTSTLHGITLSNAVVATTP